MTKPQRHFVVDPLRETLPEAGIFTWNIPDNVVFADPLVAELFGLDPDETTLGLPIERYLVRVHPADRAPLAKTIRDVIIAETPQQSSYRVQDVDGKYRSVAAFGRAFRDRRGEPIVYSGVVVPTVGMDGSSSIAY